MKKPRKQVALEKRLKSALRVEREITKRLAKHQKYVEKLRREIARLQPADASDIVRTSKGPSYGVKFVRRKKLSEIKGPSGWVSCPGTVRVSDRRFKTIKEAKHHGKRFTKIEGHKSFSVFKSQDPVNAYVNWRTGKTNPIIGLRRTNRG